MALEINNTAEVMDKMTKESRLKQGLKAQITKPKQRYYGLWDNVGVCNTLPPLVSAAESRKLAAFRYPEGKLEERGK